MKCFNCIYGILNTANAAIKHTIKYIKFILLIKITNTTKSTTKAFLTLVPNNLFTSILSPYLAPSKNRNHLLLEMQNMVAFLNKFMSIYFFICMENNDNNNSYKYKRHQHYSAPTFSL